MVSGCSDPDFTVSVLAPALVPSVQVPIGVAPAMLVVGAPVRLPPPAVTLTSNRSPASGFPFPSFTMTERVATDSPAAAVAGAADESSSEAGPEGPAVSEHAETIRAAAAIAARTREKAG